MIKAQYMQRAICALICSARKGITKTGKKIVEKFVSHPNNKSKREV